MTDVDHTILIIDDDPRDRLRIKEVLSTGPFRVREASSLVEGIGVCGSESCVAAVLLDLMLAESQGLSTVQAFRKVQPDVPVIMLSGLADEDIALQAVEHGAQDYLAKDGLDLAVASRAIRYAIQRQDMQSQLMKMATTDAVTGLHNRSKLDIELQSAMDECCHGSGHPFAIVFIDLDDFKLVNDVYGHSTGDQLLHDFAQRIKEAIGPGDQAARFGGDEFVVVLHDAYDEIAVGDFLERLDSLVREPFNIDRCSHHVSMSIGLAIYDDCYKTPGEMLRDADTAMYQAKHEGKGGHRWFCSAMRERAKKQFGLESQLRSAVDDDQLTLYYQPIVDLRTYQVVRFEALLRWRHPVRGIVTPLDFIPFAEASRLIVPIGKWVAEAACLQLSQWWSEFPKLAVAVNVSPIQLLHHRFVGEMFAAIENAGISPASLHLEVTESTVMKNPVRARAALNELKSAGAKIVMDDFGTGYSSLGQLYEFPYDALKIDRAFIASVADDDAFIRSILVLAESLGLDVVAEGIEDQGQIEQLLKLECFYGQGFKLGHPMPAREATEWLRRGWDQTMIEASNPMACPSAGQFDTSTALL